MFKRAEPQAAAAPVVLAKRKGQRKLKAGAVTRSIAGRVLHPKHLVNAIKLQRARKANKRAYDDVHLALLAKLLPGGYLHYGYFDDTERPPREISVAEIERAQKRYAELLVDLATDKEAPVLFICRSGGRSHNAAMLAMQAGYTQCYNVLEGFEGDKDAAGHRNTKGGWRASGLPWSQS